MTGESSTIDKKDSDESSAATSNLASAVRTAGIEIDSTFALKASLLAESFSSSSLAKDLDCDIPKGCEFSPDGTCLLTARGNKLELYNTPYDDETTDGENDESSETATNLWEPALTCNGGETVRSYAWYPHMNSSDPATCCFLGVSRDSPVHLYDAYDGSVRATYRPYNCLDEMESPTTIKFVENGQKLVTGGLRTDRILHVFDINRPGRDHSTKLRLGKTRRSKDGQKGLVSAMTYSEHKGVIAVGTYSPGSIYLYDLRAFTKSGVAEIVASSSASTSSGGTICLSGHGKKNRKNKRKRFATTEVEDDENLVDEPVMNFSAAKLQWYQSRTRGGVTQVEFEDESSNGGNYLFSTSRRANSILQWDLRKLSSSNFCPGIASFETNNETNQRIEFQVRGDQLWTGGTEGCVRVYSHKLQSKDHLLAKLTGFKDCVNGISLHPDAQLDFETNNNEAQSESDASTPLCSSDKSAKGLLSVALGRRHFPSENDWEDDDPHTTLTTRTKHLAGSIQIHSLAINQ